MALTEENVVFGDTKEEQEMDIKKQYKKGTYRLYNYCALKDNFLKEAMKTDPDSLYLKGMRAVLDDVMAICRDRNRY